MNHLEKYIDDEDMVEVLYKTILKRNSDEGGLKSHAHRISNLPRKDALDLLITGLLNSEEYKKNTQNSHGSLYLKSIVNNEVLDKKITINHVISLGTHCYTSQLLKKANLKNYSCPFDWIFSSPSMVAHVIEDDFNKFLDRSFFKKIPYENLIVSEAKTYPTSNEFYLNNFSVKNVFNHHDMQSEDHYNYFVRGVMRFRKLLLSSESVMFVICARHSDDALAKFSNLKKSILKRKNNSVYLRYISIEQTNNILPECVILDNTLMNFELIHYKSSSKWRDLDFESFIDDMSILKIISQGVKFELKEIEQLAC